MKGTRTMTTVLLKPEDDASHKEALRALYLEGECYAFAIAVHRGTGFSIVGLMEDGIIRHALIRKPNDMLFDVRGIIAEEEIGYPFFMNPPYTLRNITEYDLHAVRRIANMSIIYARLLAEELWPDLPWNVNGQENGLILFMDALEDLCRKHGFWIRACVPGSPPLIEKAHGDEGGYTLHRMLNGTTTYTFDRYLQTRCTI